MDVVANKRIVVSMRPYRCAACFLLTKG